MLYGKSINEGTIPFADFKDRAIPLTGDSKVATKKKRSKKSNGADGTRKPRKKK
jgi:hypothetical protein